MVSRRVGKFARPCGVQGLLLGLRLGPRRTARNKVRRMGRFGARRVDLGKLGVLESRVVVVGVLRKLSNLLLSWGLGRGRGLSCCSQRTTAPQTCHRRNCCVG